MVGLDWLDLDFFFITFLKGRYQILSSAQKCASPTMPAHLRPCMRISDPVMRISDPVCASPPPYAHKMPPSCASPTIHAHLRPRMRIKWRRMRIKWRRMRKNAAGCAKMSPVCAKMPPICAWGPWGAHRAYGGAPAGRMGPLGPPMGLRCAYKSKS